jgi:hypothetical protein
MPSHRLSSLWLVCAVACIVAPTALAASLPDDRWVLYEMHSLPIDPQSDISFQVYVHLHAVERNGQWVGWEVAELVLIDHVDGKSDRSWSIAAPYVDTGDGLWQVEHADPEQPRQEEFVLPPLIYGQAVADDPEEPDLSFTFEGVPYTPPPGGPPYPITAALDYEFMCLGQLDPLEFGWDEPVYVPSDPPEPATP